MFYAQIFKSTVRKSNNYTENKYYLMEKVHCVMVEKANEITLTNTVIKKLEKIVEKWKNSKGNS